MSTYKELVEDIPTNEEHYHKHRHVPRVDSVCVCVCVCVSAINMVVTDKRGESDLGCLYDSRHLENV